MLLKSAGGEDVGHYHNFIPIRGEPNLEIISDDDPKMASIGDIILDMALGGGSLKTHVRC
jgi:hypothetical protein